MEEYKNVEELNQLGINLMNAGNPKAALDYFLQAEKENPNYKETYINQGCVYAAIGEMDKSEESFKKVLKIDKNNAEAYENLANISYMQGNFKQGIVYANHALQCGKDDPKLLYNIARAYEELNDADMAIRFYNRAIESNPINPEYYVKKAHLLVNRMDFNNALETLAELNNNCPECFEAYHYSFLIYLQQQEYIKADQIINAGLEQFPMDMSLYYDKVRILNVVKEFDSALELIELLKQLPTYETEKRNIMIEEAKIYLQTERADEAVKVLEEAVSMPAPNFEAHYLLENTYLSMGRFEDVIKIASEMKNADDGSEFARGARYYLPMATYKAKGIEAAKPLYNEAIEYYRFYGLKNPRDLDTYLYRALCYKDLQQFDKALNTLDYGIKLKADFAPFYVVRANIYKEMGESEKYNSEMKEARKINPELENLLELFEN